MPGGVLQHRETSGLQAGAQLLPRLRDLLSVIVQSIPQLQDRYPKTEWEELIGCTDIQICLGCNDVDTATYISKKCGMVTIKVENNQMPLLPLFSPVYSSTRPYSQTKSNTQRALMLPDEIMRMDNQESLDLGGKIFISKKEPHKESQVWNLIPCGDGCYSIVSPLTELGIDNSGNGSKECPVIQWTLIKKIPISNGVSRLCPMGIICSPV